MTEIKQKYYLNLGGQLIGPYKKEELIELIKAGDVRPEDSVFRVGDDKWLKVLALAEFAEVKVFNLAKEDSTKSAKGFDLPTPQVQENSIVKKMSSKSRPAYPEFDTNGGVASRKKNVASPWSPRFFIALTFIFIGVGVGIKTYLVYQSENQQSEGQQTSGREDLASAPAALPPPPPVAAPTAALPPPPVGASVSNEATPPEEIVKEELSGKTDSGPIFSQKNAVKKKSFQSQQERKRMFQLVNRMQKHTAKIATKKALTEKELKVWKKEFLSYKPAEFNSRPAKLLFATEWKEVKSLYDQWLKKADSMVKGRKVASQSSNMKDLSRKTAEIKKRVQTLSIQ